MGQGVAEAAVRAPIPSGPPPPPADDPKVMPSITNAAQRVLHEIFERVASDLSMLADRDIEVLSVDYEERTDRVAGPGRVHISFRFGVLAGGSEVHHGAMIVPLPEAIALAGYLMMSPDDQVAAMREAGTVDLPVKEALVEVGNFVASASDAALRAIGSRCDRVIFEGCQGVRADVRPRLDYEEGAPLSVGRALISVAGLTPAECVVMIPKKGYLAGT